MNTNPTRHLFRHIAAVATVAAFTAGGAAALFTALPAAAQDYPSKPIKFLVGFSPGGSADLISRFVAQKLGERLGQPIVVEQRLGATGIIAQDAVAKATPDGYTMVLLTGGHATSAVMKKKLPYHPVNDFAMVSTIIEYPMAIGVRPDSPIKSFPDLLARAKAEPGKPGRRPRNTSRQGDTPAIKSENTARNLKAAPAKRNDQLAALEKLLAQLEDCRRILRGVEGEGSQLTS